MGAMLSRLFVSKDGVTAVEYGLIAALIAVAAVSALMLVGTNLRGVFNTISSFL